MGNTPFQKTLNIYPAESIAGKLATTNPHRFFPVVPTADADGITIGLGCFYDATDRTVSNKGTTGFIGFAVAEMVYGNYDLQDGASMVATEGEPVTVLTHGDIYVNITGTPAFGDNVYVNTTTGALVFDDATTAPTGTVATGFKVVDAKTGAEVVIISK